MEYMYLLKKHPILNGYTNEGVAMEDILKYQNEYNIIFPNAYREFLQLAGNRCNLLMSMNHFFQFAIERQEYTKETLKEEGYSIGEDFWVIADLDGGEQFHFFYFNDPDAEDPENPPVYGSFTGYPAGTEHAKVKLANTLQEYIEGLIKD